MDHNDFEIEIDQVRSAENLGNAIKLIDRGEVCQSF